MDQNTTPIANFNNVASSPAASGPQCSHHHEFQKYRELLDNASALIVQVRDALAKSVYRGSEAAPPSASILPPLNSALPSSPDRVVEGVFNGYAMVGDDTKQYPVPPNYASKSKLVDGDRLKLIVRGNGQFVYKQIGPVERERRVGVLQSAGSEGSGFTVEASGRTYNVLGASITYYHGQPGDEVVLLVPRGGVSPWAAVENIIRVSSAPPAPQTPSPVAAPAPPSIDPLDDISSLLPSARQP